MPAKTRATHRRIGEKLGYDIEVDEVVVQCGCGKTQSAELPSDESIKRALPLISCTSCGRVGTMRMWRPDATKGAA